MKVPRDIHAGTLINLLYQYGYSIIRQTGSHIRLSKKTAAAEHMITVPDHKPLKIGTLQAIVKDVCDFNELDINSFYKQL
jgi:predicted RNA binding protein YcfA (HicA-like mRNA interferase family)